MTTTPKPQTPGPSRLSLSPLFFSFVSLVYLLVCPSIVHVVMLRRLKRRIPVGLQFEYTSDFDDKGIIYYIATNCGREPWVGRPLGERSKLILLYRSTRTWRTSYACQARQSRGAIRQNSSPGNRASCGPKTCRRRGS
jgi:hypothetical protein